MTSNLVTKNLFSTMVLICVFGFAMIILGEIVNSFPERVDRIIDVLIGFVLYPITVKYGKWICKRGVMGK